MNPCGSIPHRVMRVVFPRLIVPRRAVTVAGLVVAVGCAAAAAATGVVPWMLGSFLGALAVVASLLVGPAGSSRSSTLAWWYPVAGLPLLVVTVSAATVAGWLDAPLWGGSWFSVATWTVVVAGFAALAWRRGGYVRLAGGLDAVAWAPALVLAGIGAWLLTQPSHMLMRAAFLATDYVEHAWLVSDLAGDRNLTYPISGSTGEYGLVDTYPRGVHATIAWLVSIPGLPTGGTERWITSLAAVIMGAWLATVLTIAVMGLTITVAARRLSRSLLPTTAAAIIGIAALGVVMAVGGRWLVIMTLDGFLTTAAAAWLLAVVVLVASRDKPTQRAGFLLTAVAACLLMAHLWTLLLPPLAVVALLALIAWWRSGHPHVVPVLLAVAGMTVLALPVLWSVATGFGINYATSLGTFGAYPLAVTVTVAVAFVVVAVLAGIRVGHRGWWVTWLVLVVGLLVTGLLLLSYTTSLGAADNLPRGQVMPYYPAKVLWHPTVLAFPALAAGAGVAVALAWRAPAVVTRQSLTLIRVGIVVGISMLVSGALITEPVWNQARAAWRTQTLASADVAYALLALAATQDALRGAVIVRGLHPGGLAGIYGRTDMFTYRVLSKNGWLTAPETATVQLDSAPLCTWLTDHPDAVRITGPNPNYGPAELLRNGCPASVVQPDKWLVLTAPEDWGAPDWTSFTEDIPSPILPGGAPR